MTGLATLPLRSKLWLASVVLCLAFYALRSTPLPRKTVVGVERRVIAGAGFLLLERQGAAGWLVSVAPSAPPSGPQAPTGERLASWLRHSVWPSGAITGRRLAPFREHGTWALEPFGLRRVWRLRGERIHDGRLLIAGPDETGYFSGEAIIQVLDLKTRRTLRGAQAQRAMGGATADVDGDWMGYLEVEESKITAESAGLEGIGSALTEPLDVQVGARRLTLWSSASAAASVIAVSDEPTPRVLPLAKNASPTALSADGRVLFFERDGALWRLDLRRPLPELLDEAPPPPLPEPPL
ncbi:MAG: hypothetical protein ACO1SX_15225 [Actinomycetota bacterium]